MKFRTNKKPRRVRAETVTPEAESKQVTQNKLTKRPARGMLIREPQTEEVIRRRVMSVSGASARGSHQLSDALTCEQKWSYRYGLGIRPKYSRDFQVIGTLVHTRLAYYLAGLLNDKPAWLARPIEDQLEEDAQGFPLLLTLSDDVAKFVIRSLEMNQYPIIPALVEHEWRLPLGEIANLLGIDPEPATRDEIVTSRSDAVVWEPDGTLSILDHKCTSSGNRSTGRLGAWHPEQYQAGLQPFLNILLARAQMKKTGGPTVRHFKIHRVKRTHPFDRDINYVTLPEQAFIRAYRMCEAAVARELEMYKRLDDGLQPRVNLSACNGRFGLCDYYGACLAQSPDIRDDILRENFVTIGSSRMLPVLPSAPVSVPDPAMSAPEDDPEVMALFDRLR